MLRCVSSTSDSSFAHITSGGCARKRSVWANPQSVPAIMLSRPDNACVANEPICHHSRMFNNPSRGVAHSGNEDLSIWQFPFCQHATVLVSGVGCLKHVGAGTDLKNQVNDIRQGSVRCVWPVPAAKQQ